MSIRNDLLEDILIATGAAASSTYQGLTDTAVFAGNAKKVPLVNDGETALTYATKFIFDDTNGYFGIGGTPTKPIDIQAASGEVAIRLHSDDGKGALILDGSTLTDSSVGDLSFRNNGDSIVIISGERDGADDAGALEFKTQTTGGSMNTHMRLDSIGSLYLYDLAESSASNPPLTIDETTKEIKFDTAALALSAPAGQFSVASGGSWVDAAQISGVPTYTYTEIAISTGGLILLDNSDLSLVTLITVSKEGSNGADFSALFEKLINNDVVALSDFLDNTNYMIANVTGSPVSAGVTWQIPVSVTDSNGVLTVDELTSFSIKPVGRTEIADMAIDRLLEGESDLAAQNPTGLGIANAIKVSFGAAQGTVLDPVMLDANGLVTFNESNLVRVTALLQFGRDGASGTSDLYFRYLINGTQLGRSINQHLSNSNDLGYFEITNWFNAPAGATLELELMRDLDGNNSGGVTRHTPTDEGAGTWNPSPCAVMRIERLVNNP